MFRTQRRRFYHRIRFQTWYRKAYYYHRKRDKIDDYIAKYRGEDALKDLDARGKRVAALWSDGVSVYSQTLSEQGTYGDVQGVKGVLLRKKGDAALLYSASVLIKTF